MSDNPRVTILHVDDYDGTRYTVSHILRQAGFDVISTASGEEALQRATEKPRLIILDVNLPDINGWEVCQQLKANPITASIPVLYLSATYVSSADKVQGLSGGADGFLTEPVEPSELVATVQALLRARQTEETLRERNRELERLVQELRSGDEGLRRLHRELADSNSGVRALHAELDEKAELVRHVHQLQLQLLTRLSHECRTPLNSILALSRFLLERTDGELTAEQERQVSLIRQATETLLALVNNTLDLAHFKTGQQPVRPEVFTVDSLFSALRGMFRPLLDDGNVALAFEEPRGIPPLSTDRGKVLQILRNLVCNALRFTEHGEVRVSAMLTPDGQAVEFRVTDTGVGIAPEDQQRIFEQFVQLRSPGQEQVRGVGLGLSLVREFTQLLKGRVTVQSQPDVGSTFSAVIPLVYTDGPGP
jgi:signal transduction histidine kinase